MPKMGSNKTDNCSQELSSFQNILFQRPSILETLNHSSAITEEDRVMINFLLVHLTVPENHAILEVINSSESFYTTIFPF